MGTGREGAMRKEGGLEARSVQSVCDLCTAHGKSLATDLPSVSILIRSCLREDETHLPLVARVECRAFVSERILVGAGTLERL